MGVIKLLWFEAEGYVCFETQGQGVRFFFWLYFPISRCYDRLGIILSWMSKRMLTDRSTYERRIGQTDANILGYEML